MHYLRGKSVSPPLSTFSRKNPKDIPACCRESKPDDPAAMAVRFAIGQGKLDTVSNK
jgi:hypothetical protein